MRNFIMIAILAITVPFLDVPSASAEGLKGEQIKKLLIGNTVFSRSENLNRVKIRRWVYYKDGSTRIVQQVRTRKGSDRWIDFVTKWRVTKDGKYCHGLRSGRPEKCRKNVRIKGNIIEMDGVDGASNLEYELLKGNPKNLKVEEQSY